MALSPGTRLGPYEIAAQIGAGGMGEVYRARDTKLDRDVAIKVLPAAVAADAERLARFEREAKTLAALNHPNIASIHGFEDDGQTKALVMELVEGSTLADRVAQGPIQLDEALPIARQIAEALEAAHEQGIVHRDLKPANVKVRPDGTVKVLDFGLAKAMEPTGAQAANQSLSPTITTPAMTQAGVILGTAAYMSPEQARGQAVDRRTDIWAFGCVLYEMLTGRKVFGGDTVTDALASIVNREPDWGALPADTPVAIRRLLRRCLRKDARARLRDAADARLELVEVDEAAVFENAGAHGSTATPRWQLALLAVSVLIVAAIAGAAVSSFRAEKPEMRVLDVVTPPTSSPVSFALSPDGRQLAFVARGDGGPQLWVRSLDQDSARALEGTAQASFPFWAPDSSRIGFFADGDLRYVPAEGGRVVTVASAPSPRGGTWGPDGVIVYQPQATGGVLMQVREDGGEEPAPATSDFRPTASMRWPHFLPGGRRFLFQALDLQANPDGIFLASLDGGEPTPLVTLTAGDSEALYADGYLFLVSGGTLVAHPFDVDSGEITGDPVPVAASVGVQLNGLGAFSVTASGLIAYRSRAENPRQLVWFDRNGQRGEVVGSPDSDALAEPDLALAGEQVAVSRWVQGNIDVWLVDVATGYPRNLTLDPAIDMAPILSPDGRRVAFMSNRGGIGWDLFDKSADGGGETRPLFESPSNLVPKSWSPDGRFLLYVEATPAGTGDLWVLPLDGDPTPVAVAVSEHDEYHGQFSPDGQWIAYTSNETGTPQIWVQPFPRTDSSRWQVSLAGGGFPRWSPTGTELFFLAPDDTLMAVPVRTVSGYRAFVAGEPVPLFPAPVVVAGTDIYPNGSYSAPQYVVAEDGRFLLNTELPDDVPPIKVMLNWTAGLTP